MKNIPGNHNIKPDFLNRGEWEVLVVKDDPDRQKNVIIDNLTIAASDQLIINLNPEGGYVAQFIKK